MGREAAECGDGSVQLPSFSLLLLASVVLLVVVVSLELGSLQHLPDLSSLHTADAQLSASAGAAVPASSHDGSELIPRLPPVDAGEADWLRRHPLFFLHCPKTAGQSFTRLLLLLLRPHQRLYNASLRPALTPRLDVSFMREADAVRLTSPEQRDAFTTFSSRHLLLSGHTDVLIAEAYRHSGREVRFVSMMRRPAQRVLSLFCFIMRCLALESKDSARCLEQHTSVFPSWASRARSRGDWLSADSFRAFVTLAVDDGVDNWQTRAFAGCLHTSVVPASAQPSLCSDPQAMLQEAQRQLASFLFVGLTEHNNASVALLKYTIRFDPSLPENQRLLLPTAGELDRLERVVNVNAEKQRCLQAVAGSGSLSAEQDSLLGRVESLDEKLYASASRLFWQRIAALPPEWRPKAAPPPEQPH